jgi:hypothetical protein
MIIDIFQALSSLSCAFGAMVLEYWMLVPSMFLFGQSYIALETYIRRRPVRLLPRCTPDGQTDYAGTEKHSDCGMAHLLWAMAHEYPLSPFWSQHCLRWL